MLERNQNNMPPDFEPPVPAWAADWASGPQVLTTGVFGTQGEPSQAWLSWVRDNLLATGAADRVEQAYFTDLEGLPNTVYIAYWCDERYQNWWSQAPTHQWWHNRERESEECGYWREVFSVPTHRLETLHSTAHAHGVATLAPQLEGPVAEHGYPGAARDRIPDSGRESLEGAESVGRSQSDRTHEQPAETVGVWIKPAANLCIIRSGQDWGHCDATEKQFYINDLAPTLTDGMRYLSENPEESRCLSMRLMTMRDESGNNLPQTFGLGYALDIFAFEQWAKSHPTHLRIFDQFMQHAERFADQMQLRLWHEVSVLQEDSSEMQYIGCHPKTGLLPYL